MDTELFLQTLRDLSLEEGKVYIQEHVDELSDHAAIGNLLADEALRLLYSPFVSLKLAELLIYFGECVQHTSSHALGLKAKGDALRYIGHHQAAIECLDAAGDEFLGLGDVGNWARSRISWITASAWLGRIEEALQEGNRARDSFVQLGEYYWVCIVDSNMAIIYALSGRYHDALNIFERMLAIYPTITDQDEIFITRAIAIAEVNQAEILSWLGRFEEAYHLFQLAQTRFMSLDETSMIIYSVTHLADLDYKQGFYGSALRRYYKARDTVSQNNVDNPTLLAEMKLGNFLLVAALIDRHLLLNFSKLNFFLIEARLLKHMSKPKSSKNILKSRDSCRFLRVPAL
jgi:tetratricopeptide (TPR) repeat protein